MSERILAIDPGSVVTGYGCIEKLGSKITVLTSGTIRLKNEEFHLRLKQIHNQLCEVIEEFKPTVVVIEKAFVSKNVQSALKLGQVRGALMLLAAFYDLDFAEYAPTEIKQAVTGQGRADKEMVTKMVSLITGKREFDRHDEADALAIAICHAQRVKFDFRKQK